MPESGSQRYGELSTADCLLEIRLYAPNGMLQALDALPDMGQLRVNCDVLLFKLRFEFKLMLFEQICQVVFEVELKLACTQQRQEQLRESHRTRAYRSDQRDGGVAVGRHRHQRLAQAVR